MSNRKLTLVRLQKEQAQLEKDDTNGVIVRRKGVLNFHFCIYGLGEEYEGGFYHGVLQLHEDYPFAPPTLKFFTPSGRFETNKPICTTFTNFHKESWSSAWNIRSMVLATISYMTGKENGTGCLNQSCATKRAYARKTIHFNLQNQQFCTLFEAKLYSLGLIQKAIQKSKPEKPQLLQQTHTNYVNILLFILVLLLVLWIAIKLH